MITVIGIGIESGDLTSRGKMAMKKAAEVYSRGKTRYKSVALNKQFEDCESYEELDERISGFLIGREKTGADVAFLCIGDGFSDTAVKLLAEKTDVVIIPGVADNRPRLPSESFMTLSAYDVQSVDTLCTRLPLLVYQIDDKFVAGDVKLALMKFYSEDYPLTLTSDKEQLRITLEDLDRVKIKQGSAAYFEADRRLVGKKRYGFGDLLYIMKRLTAPDGCPWDRAQTHESIAVNMLEEAYEAVDAINHADSDNLREELGDVILQSVFHAEMSEKEGDFDINDVINDLCVKLVTRHTHIFGDKKAANADEALLHWERAKAKEKRCSALPEQLARLPENFPATLLLNKFAKKANKAGAGLTPELLKKCIADNLDKQDEESMEKLLAAAVMLASDYDMAAEELMLRAFVKLKETASVRNIAGAVRKLL